MQRFAASREKVSYRAIRDPRTETILSSGLLIGSDLPGITPSILHHAPTIAIRKVHWLFDDASAARNRALVSRLDIGHVDIEHSVRLCTHARSANHDFRISNREHTRSFFLILAIRIEHLLDELHESLHIVDDDAWDDGGPTFGRESRT